MKSTFQALLLGALLATSAWAQTRELDLHPAAGWIDSGIDLKPGDTFGVVATGELQYTGARDANGPEGLPRGFADLIRVCSSTRPAAAPSSVASATTPPPALS